jgi:hypothetical protein
VVANDPGGIASSQGGKIGIAVRAEVDSAGEGGLKETLIAQPRGTAVLNDEEIVDRENQTSLKPDRLSHSASCHLASSRSVLRYFFMTFWALLSWISNSGS